jgi:hypothetical protein
LQHHFDSGRLRYPVRLPGAGHVGQLTARPGGHEAWFTYTDSVTPPTVHYGRVYYYYFEGQRSFDPLSRGAVAQRDVDVLLRDDDGPKPLVIYEIIH